jgi:hypothetical protein
MTYLVLVGSEAEVLNSLSGVLGSSEEQGVASSGSSKSQLIQSQNLSSSSEDAGTSRSGEAKSGNAELGDGQETVVIGDSANNDNGLVVGLLGGIRNNSGDGNRGSVDAGHEKSAENYLIEGGVGSAYGEEGMISIIPFSARLFKDGTYEPRSDTASRVT